jgi:ABC transport system ATP-binding/permease protein
MNLVSVEGVSKQYAETPLFSDVSFGIGAGERVGVIGLNGSGKSTLLRIVAGEETPDSGRVVVRNDARVVYLPQNPLMDPAQTALDYLFAGDDPRVRLIREYEDIAARLHAAPDDEALLARLAGVGERIEVAGAWDVEREAREILARLGVGATQDALGTLSGGQRRRVAMARALMEHADLLILDEPTNHIDADTIAWLEAFLKRSPVAVFVITHDRYFLDRLVTRLVEIDRGKVYQYEGGYARYLQEKAQRADQAVADAERYTSIMRKELAWLQRGARARTTKQQARIDRIEAMQADAPERAGTELTFTVRSPQRLGKRVIEIVDIHKAWGERRVLDGLTQTIGRGDRIGIVGPNGSGKSTLLNMLAGRVAPDRGEIVIGETVRMAYFDQESTGLDERLRVIDYLNEAAPLIQTVDGSVVSAAQMLERFLFPPSTQAKLIGTLSGGERRRLFLLRTLLFGPNVLVLDEPTNDLDIQTLSVLEDYLDGYDGTLIVASHDRYFLDRTVQRILAFEGDGRVGDYAGDYTAYAAEHARRQAAHGAEHKPRPQGQRAAPPASARPRGLTFKQQRELAEVEQRIAAIESEQHQLNEALATTGDNYVELTRLSERLAQTTGELDAAFERWAELSEIAEAAKK